SRPAPPYNPCGANRNAQNERLTHMAKKETREPSKSQDLERSDWSTEIDSKYRLIILAARRARQLPKGARGRQNACPKERNIKSLGIPGSVSVSRIRSAVREVAEETLDRES